MNPFHLASWRISINSFQIHLKASQTRTYSYHSRVKDQGVYHLATESTVLATESTVTSP